MKPYHLLPLATALPFLMAAPPRVSPEDLVTFERLVAPRIIPDLGGATDFQEADLLNSEVDLRLAGYLQSVDQTILISETDDPEPVTGGDPLKDLFEPGPESIVIVCSKGIYLDGENRELVYLGDISIKGQGLTMTCKKDLKAIFAAPPVEEKKNGKSEDKADEPLAKFSGFGDLEQFTAAGDVRLSGVDAKGKTFYVGGDRALYTTTTKEDVVESNVTFKGDQIAFKLITPAKEKAKGTTIAMRSVSKNAWFKAIVRGETIFVEWSPNGWETHLGIPEAKKKK